SAGTDLGRFCLPRERTGGPWRQDSVRGEARAPVSSITHRWSNVVSSFQRCWRRDALEGGHPPESAVAARVDSGRWTKPARNGACTPQERGRFLYYNTNFGGKT